MDNSKISVFMIKDHLRILSLLHGVEKAFNGNLSNRLESFNILKWNIKKHFFVEEKAIFSYFEFEKNGREERNLYFEISKQHKKIMNNLENIYENLIRNLGIDAVSLRDLLNEHLSFEEKVAYVKLDKIISESEKMHIINQLKGIVR